jgi:uncharacterized phage protein gp47/JayE
MKRLLIVVTAALLGSAAGNVIRKSFIAPETGGAEGKESELVITGSLVGSAAAALAGLFSRRWGWLIAFVASAALTAATGEELDHRVAGITGRGQPAARSADAVSD